MNHREFRGVSVGTILMLFVTVVTLGSFSVILPRLMGTANLRVNAASMAMEANLTGSLPELVLRDIPLGAPEAEPAEEEAATDPAPVMPTEALEIAVTPEPVPEAPAGPSGSFTLTIGGSVIIDDSVSKSAYFSDSNKYDFSEIFSLIRDDLNADVTLVTLENAIIPDSKVTSLVVPDSALEMLTAGGVDMVALGHSRSMDKGAEGLMSTIDAVRAAGLEVVGAYRDEAESGRIVMVKQGELQVAFLHYTETLTSAGKKALRSDKAAALLPMTMSGDAPHGVISDIARAREDGADVVIVSINWSGTGSFKINANVKNFAQQLADAGADVIVGAGTKTLQPVTWLTSRRDDGTLRQTLCAWSLGSLLNGDRNDANVAGMLLQLQISLKDGVTSFERVSYAPTFIWRYKQDGQYQYRVVASDLPAPDAMSEEHQNYMKKALNNTRKALGDSPITLRTR